MPRAYKTILPLMPGSWGATGVYAQALDQISVKKGVEISGSLSANTVAYTAAGIEARRDPFNWFLQDNLNISLFSRCWCFSPTTVAQALPDSQTYCVMRFTSSAVF